MRNQFIEADPARHAFHRLSLSQVARVADLLTDSGKAAQRHNPSMLASGELRNYIGVDMLIKKIADAVGLL